MTLVNTQDDGGYRRVFKVGVQVIESGEVKILKNRMITPDSEMPKPNCDVKIIKKKIVAL
jgi:hypothetical protein